MQRAFAFDARQLLASDLLIVSDQPLPSVFLEQAQSRQLKVAQTVVFPSMATVDANSKLASLKAVSPEYPLRGALRVKAKGGVNPLILDLAKVLCGLIPLCWLAFMRR